MTKLVFFCVLTHMSYMTAINPVIICYFSPWVYSSELDCTSKAHSNIRAKQHLLLAFWVRKKFLQEPLYGCGVFCVFPFGNGHHLTPLTFKFPNCFVGQELVKGMFLFCSHWHDSGIKWSSSRKILAVLMERNMQAV